jgi:hypothetical protein
MSKRSFTAGIATTGNGTADNAVLTTLQFMHLDPGSASQMIFVEEIEISGLAGTTAPQNMQLRRDGTLATGAATALASPNSDGPLNNFAAALTTVPIASMSYATTMPTPSNSATLARLNLAFNAFGGIIRWLCAAGEQWWMVGNAVNIASTLSNNTGSTSSSVGAHIIYELA